LTRSPCSFTKKEPERAAVLFLETKGTAALSSLICFPVLETKTPSRGPCWLASQNRAKDPLCRFSSTFPHLLRPTALASASGSFLPQPPNSQQRQQQPSNAHRPAVLGHATGHLKQKKRKQKKTCRDAADVKRRRGRSRSENSERKINCCYVCGCFCRLPPSRKVKRGGSYNRAPVG
jgi:hypothetical protein